MPITEVDKIWMNGKLVDFADAKVHVFRMEYPDTGEGPIAPIGGTFIPTVNVTHPQLPTSLVVSDLTRMTVHTGYVHDADVESRFATMGFTVYYSTSADHAPPAITDPGPADSERYYRVVAQ